MQPSLSSFCGNSTGFDRDAGISAVQHSQHRNEVWLGLDGHHASADAAEDAYPISNVRTDIESQVAGLQELAVERLEPSATPNGAVIGDERTSNTGATGDHVSPPHSEATQISLQSRSRPGGLASTSVPTRCALMSGSFTRASINLLGPPMHVQVSSQRAEASHDRSSGKNKSGRTPSPRIWPPVRQPRACTGPAATST